MFRASLRKASKPDSNLGALIKAFQGTQSIKILIFRLKQMKIKTSKGYFYD